MPPPKQDVEHRIENLESQLKDALAQIEALKSAQSEAQDVTFGKIVCRKLTVIDEGEAELGEEGHESVVLESFPDYGGFVYAYGKDGGSAQLFNDENGGSLAIFNKARNNMIRASVADDGRGIVETKDKNGNQTGKLP